MLTVSLFNRRLATAVIATVFLATAAACASAQAPVQQPAAESGAKTQPPAADTQAKAPALGYARPELLVETDWLVARLNDPKLRILDVRAADKYQADHIPGAVQLASGQLDKKYGEVQNVKPAEEIAGILGNLGIGKDTQVVIYDDSRTLTAGRVFWVLDYYGHPSISILNGGYPKWQAEKREVARQAPKIEPATFVAKADPSKIADAEFIKANLGKNSVALCDARTKAEYEGTDVRAARGGAIPGAKNLNWENNVTAGDTPQMLLAADLKKLYEGAGITPDQEVVTYCQTGVRSSQAYFTLKLIGYTRVRNYDGSWEDWGNNASLPLEKKG